MKNYVPAFITQISILFFVIMIPAAAAQTFEVTRTDDPPPNGCISGSDCSLREAIIAANSDQSQDKIIQLTGGQTYNLTIPGDIIGSTFVYEGETIFRVSTNDTEGSLKILNPARTVRIESTGSQPATIYTENVQIAIMFGKGTSAVLDGIIVSGNHAGGIGGILVYNNSDLTIKNSQIINTGHTSVYFEGAKATIENSVVADNEGTSGGAGLSISNYADFDGENFVGMVNSDVSIINSTIENNTASIGAGIVIEPDQKLLISGTTIQGNHAAQWGGGIYVTGGTVDINNSSIINNTSRNASGSSGRGAGIFVSSGEITLVNTTLSGNEVGNGVNSGSGGAIYSGMFSTAVMTIVNSTVTDNSAWQIGGLLWWGGTLNIGNTIIANQDIGNDCSIQSQGEEPVVFTSLGHNLESGASCGFTETGDKQNLNAFLGPLQDNGGTVYTHALLTDPMSPAINSGSNALYTNAGGNLTADTDANGNPRVFNIGSGGIIDIGAFELQQNAVVTGCPATSNVLYVREGFNGSGANWPDALGELHEALALFENETCTLDEIDEIWVAAGTYLPTNNTSDRSASFNMISELDVLGGFSGSETNKNQRNRDSNITILSGDIDGDGTLAGNSYHVVTATNDGFAAILDGFTITGGNANGSSPHNTGGGLYANNGTLYVSNSRFEDNFASSDGGGAYATDNRNLPVFTQVVFQNNKTDGSGGGLAVNNSNPRLTHVTFENNTAEQLGGGMYNNNSDPLLRNVFFIHNYANTQGGGMANSSSSPRLYNAEFYRNRARFNGGAIDNAFSGTLSLYNSTIYGNEAEEFGTEFSGNGGGIYNRNGAVLNIHNSIIWGNSAAATGNQIWNAGPGPAELFYSLYGNEPGDVVEGGGFTATNSLTADPSFMDASGGDLTLASSSAAVNSGDPDTDLAMFRIQPNTPVDLAGNPRVFNPGGGGIIDMGAYEFQGEPGSGPEFAPFITSWKTDNPGDSDDHSIRIPMIGGGYDFTVDWGDGSDPQDHTANPDNNITHLLEHTYASAGTYTVGITGDFPRIYFLNADDREKILTVEQWGDIEWTSMQLAFHGTSNLNVVADDAPDLSNVDNMASMFRLAVNMNGDINHWNTANITDMNSMFEDATSFNQDLSNWNTGKVTSMEEMFEDATSFNGDISTWNTGEVQTMREMFKNAASFNGDLGSWQTGSVTSMNQMFDGAASFNGDIGEWDVRNVAQMGDMFEYAASFNQDISGWQTQALTSMVYMFRGATSFNQDISGWDISKVRYMWSVFRGATSFNQDLSDWDISGVESMMNMFDNSGMSTRFYDATLIGWAALAVNSGVQSGVELGAAGLTYCAGTDARDILTGGPHNWVISGDTETEACGDPAGAPAIPQLSLPFNNATDVVLPVTLQWGAADNAEEYSLQVALDAEFVTIAAEVSSTEGTAFEIAELEAGKIYYWRVSSHGNGETSSWSTTWSFEVSTSTSILPDSEIPKVAELLQNYPNPFNPATVISFTLPEVSDVRLEVYNMLGRQVSLLVDERKQPGRHTVTFQAGTLSSGIYIYRLRTGDFVQTRKMLLVK